MSFKPSCDNSIIERTSEERRSLFWKISSEKIAAVIEGFSLNRRNDPSKRDPI